MDNQGPIRIGIILASAVPSLFCLGASAYLLANHIPSGWGWMMFVGFMALELPKKAIQATRPRKRDRQAADYRKPEPIYDEEFV
jgi:hypothetical protein